MEREVVLEVVERGRRRLAGRRAWRWGSRVMLAWGSAVLLLVLVRTIVPIALPFEWLAVGGLLAGMLSTLALAAGWRGRADGKEIVVK